MGRQDRDPSYDLLHQYLQEISKIPRLTPEREKELGRRARQDDKRAIEELVKANLRFVVSYAKRFRNAHVLFLDLINEGNIGLIQAARKYDPDKNVKFITYAVWWIRQSILHALSEQGGAFRLPPKQANLMYRLEKAITRMVTEENRMPVPEELAAELGVPLREVQTLLQVGNDNFSLSTHLDEDGQTDLEDVIEQTMMESAEEELQRQATRQQLLDRMATLSPRERLVLTLRHGVSDCVPMRIAEIASFLDKSSEEVEERLRSAVETVCHELKIDEGELSHLLLYTNPNPESSWTFWVALGDLPEGISQTIHADRIEFLERMKHGAEVQRRVDALPLEERIILKLRYGVLQDEELTLRDIGEILNLSRERIRQIESRAEAKCRRRARG
ncbi:MAG TPA: sigma-70 family RNA polymerase sigma factor [Thermoanaerobaculia bacterium]|nr:sigma-70 family RNA polymerase sigma factor [Thermoanaerobaculia bacterium]